MPISHNIKDRIENQGRLGAALSNAEINELDNEIESIFFNIKSAKDYCAAEQHINELGKLQELLALLLFKYDISLSSKQKMLVREFDRSEDSDLRLCIYHIIKNGSIY